MRREFHVRFCERPGVRFPRATHLVLLFDLERDARRVLAALPKRFSEHGLMVHPTKTRLIELRRPNLWNREKPKVSFDFLGFTHV